MYTPPLNSPPCRTVSRPGTPVSIRPKLRGSDMRYSTTRQDHAKACSPIHAVLDTHRSAHRVTQRLHQPQTEAERPCAPGRRLVEAVEQVRQRVGVDARPVIADDQLGGA